MNKETILIVEGEKMELALQLIQAEEKERRRVSRVLHEGLQQMLVAAVYYLENLSGRIPEPEIRRDLVAVQKILSDSIQMTRTLSHELNPGILNHDNLADILQWLVHWCREKYNLVLEMEADQSISAPVEEIRVTIFRGVLELLLNVVKHANVSFARLSLVKTDSGAARITVSDEGRGFDTAICQDSDRTDKGIGLFQLRERLESIGGKLEVESSPGRGCRVSLQTPPTSLAPAQKSPPATGLSIDPAPGLGELL